MSAGATDPANLWPEIESDGLARLAYWQEKRRVEEALEKPASQRTERDWAVIAYSRHGTASGCGY